MAGEKMVKDITGVYSRLFDHRPIVQSECKFIVREFEGKRNDREVERLKESEQKLRQIQDEIPKCIESLKNLNGLQEQLKIARGKCHGILVKEEQDLQKERREEIAAECKKDWEAFVVEIAQEEKKIEEDFEQEAQKLKEKYGIKQEAHISSPSDTLTEDVTKKDS